MPRTVPRVRGAGAVAIAVASATLFALPFGYLLLKLASVGGPWQILSDADTVDTVRGSLLLAVTVTLLASAVGVSLAWFVVRTNVPGRRAWRILVPVPLVIPSFVGAHAYVSTFAPGGLLESSFGWSWVPEVRGFWGAVFVLTLLSYPYVYLPVAARLTSMPPSWEESARLLGHRPLAMLRTVVWPQLATSLLAGATLVFLYAISDFGAVSFVQYDTLTRKVFEARLDRDRSVVFSLLLGTIALIIAALSLRASRRLPNIAAAPMRQPLQYRLGRGRWWATGLVGTVLTMALAVPVAVLVWWVVRGTRSGGRRSSVVKLDEALWSSAWISVVAAVVTVAIVLPLAWLAARRPGRSVTIANVVMSAAFALPGIVIALSMVRVFVGTALYQTYFVLVLSYVLHFAGQAIGAETAAFAGIPQRLHEAARMLGAGAVRRFVTIDLRLLVPGLAAAGGLVLLSVLKELPATLMLRPIGFNTLATRIFGTAEEALLLDAGRLSLVLIGLSGMLTWALVLRRK